MLRQFAATSVSTVIDHVFPPTCLACNARVAAASGLCPTCWKTTYFIGSSACQTCGVPLDGAEDGDATCDECLTVARPWHKGRAALAYAETGRSLVMGLKHGDRSEIAKVAGAWMARQAKPLVAGPETLIVPVPLHWSRQVKRRFNQAALLASVVGRELGLEMQDSILRRVRATQTMQEMDRQTRFANVSEAFVVPPRKKAKIAGRPILLIDDVMTSGATFAACSTALKGAGAGNVCVLALARTVKFA